MSGLCWVLALLSLVLGGCGLHLATDAGGDTWLVDELQLLSRDTALALSGIIPLHKADMVADGGNSAMIKVRNERVSSRPLSWGGGARLAESLLSLELDYEISLPSAQAQEQAQEKQAGNLLRRSCKRSSNHPLDETRPLASDRQRAQLVVSMVEDCAYEMLAVARRWRARLGARQPGGGQ